MSPVRRVARATFSSLSVRNYRLFFWGQLISVTGTWMQWVAQGWLVLRLTDSGIAVGVVTALQFLPTFLGGLWGGLIADRFDKRRILVLTQSIAGVLALVLGVLTATGVVELWMVYTLALLTGCVSVVDIPARQSFIGEMVEPMHLPNAVSLGSAVFNGGRIIGPALAAVLIARVDIAPSFFANAASYIAVVAALMTMDRNALKQPERRPRARGQLREGLSFVWNEPVLRTVMILIAIVATFGMNFTVLLPLLAKFTFGGGAGVYGMLSSIMAGGALIGALAIAARTKPSWRILTGGAIAFGATTTMAAFAPGLVSEAIIIAFVGVASIALMSSCNAMVQLRTMPELRGRVAALYALVFLGGTAFGAPIAGWLGQTYGARTALAIAGVISLFAGLWARTAYHPIVAQPRAIEPTAESSVA